MTPNTTKISHRHGLEIKQFLKNHGYPERIETTRTWYYLIDLEISSRGSEVNDSELKYLAEKWLAELRVQ